MNKLLLLTFAAGTLALFSACETTEDEVRQSTTTTTTEQSVVPAAATTETRTIQTY